MPDQTTEALTVEEIRKKISSMAQTAALLKNAGYAEYLTIEEGEFVNGIWTPSRILNGDEEHIRINEPTLLKFGVHTFS